MYMFNKYIIITTINVNVLYILFYLNYIIYAILDMNSHTQPEKATKCSENDFLFMCGSKISFIAYIV